MNHYLRAVRACLRRLARDDRGTSLMELVVGMALMAVFMSIFLTSILLMTKTANKVEATSVSTSQTTQAFLRLDATVRYAGAISTPGVSTAGDWYVEFDTPPGAYASANADVCTQLRIHANQLQQRTWTVGTGVSPSSWLPLASNVTNGSAATGSPDVPFTLLAASATASNAFQRLQLTLVTTSGNSTTATNRAQVNFTALNSDSSAASNATTCQQWGRP